LLMGLIHCLQTIHLHAYVEQPTPLIFAYKVTTVTETMWA
jgi:hypothetical protein